MSGGRPTRPEIERHTTVYTDLEAHGVDLVRKTVDSIWKLLRIGNDPARRGIAPALNRPTVVD